MKINPATPFKRTEERTLFEFMSVLEAVFFTQMCSVFTLVGRKKAIKSILTTLKCKSTFLLPLKEGLHYLI